MTIKKLALEITKREGLKEQVNIAQINEILSVISDLFYEDSDTMVDLLYGQGFKRARKKKKCK